ncbi:hypothetical protein [Desulfolutivibrio sulfoxidireducens]|uniref:hypothetical protein n=1 Tax=Desulfolutivibrio sulfoxidireducens TaxID=2773299 RepID=UPI00159D8A86|nr:hypothetical protein [Desulfolutivibrio sulfoxidireducens]
MPAIAARLARIGAAILTLAVLAWPGLGAVPCHAAESPPGPSGSVPETPSGMAPAPSAAPNDLGLPGASEGSPGVEDHDQGRAVEDIKARGPLGFRGLAWGEAAGNRSDLEYLYGSGEVAYYRRTGDNLEIGEFRLKDVLYGFFRDRFFHVQMRAREPGDIAALRAAYAAKYGPPRESVTALDENYLWSWPEAQIALDRDVLEDSLSIGYTFLPILEEMRRAAPDPLPGDPVFLRPGLAVYAKRPPPDGYGGIPFGTNVALLPGMEYVFVHKDVRQYRRVGEKRRIGDIALDDVIYSFRDDKLFYVILVIKQPSPGDFERLRAAYEAKYGPYEAISPGANEHLVWSWPAAAVALIRYRDTGSLEICYAYAPVLRQIENMRIDAALEALAKKTFGAGRASGKPDASIQAPGAAAR